MIERRKFLKVALSTTALSTLSGCFSGAMVTGSGGSADWPAITGAFRNVLDRAVEGTKTTLDSLAMIAEAYGLKQEAATARAEAKNIAEKGTAFAASDLEETTNVTQELHARIARKSAQVKKLTQAQQKKIAAALVNYAPAAVLLAQAAVDVASVASDVSSAGIPTVQDGAEAIEVARDVPTKAPAIISFAQLSVKVFQEIATVARENDIAVPSTDGMPDISPL